MNCWRMRKLWSPMVQLLAPKGSCVFHMRRLWIGWRKGLRESGALPKGTFNGFFPLPLGEGKGEGLSLRQQQNLLSLFSFSVGKGVRENKKEESLGSALAPHPNPLPAGEGVTAERANKRGETKSRR